MNLCSLLQLIENMQNDQDQNAVLESLRRENKKIHPPIFLQEFQKEYTPRLRRTIAVLTTRYTSKLVSMISLLIMRKLWRWSSSKRYKSRVRERRFKNRFTAFLHQRLQLLVPIPHQYWVTVRAHHFRLNETHGNGNADISDVAG